MKNIILIFLLFVSSIYNAYSQNPFEKFVFGSTSLVNVQTVQQPPEKGFEFNIQHRFGRIDLKSDKLINEFYGLDLTSNIRFGFNFYVTEKLSLGFGRTKINNEYEFNGKYSILRQTKDYKVPVSISVYVNGSLMTDDFPPLPEYPYYQDSSTPFKYKFSHRISYFTQLIIASKINSWFSVQISPVLTYKNLVEPGYDNLIYGLSVGTWFKTGFRSGIIAEWNPVFNKPVYEYDQKYYNTISIGYEVRPVGHVFQIILTTTQHILPQAVMSEKPTNFRDGKFYLGFNLHRNLYYRTR